MTPLFARPSAHSSRRTLMQLCIAASSLWAVAGCSGVLSGERTVHVDAAKLQQKLDSRFPLDKRLFGMVNITISNPKLSFDTANNKLGTRLDLAMPSLMGMTPALKGTVDLAYGLRYDSTDNSVRMTQVQVKSLDLKDEQGRSHSRINSTLSLLGEQVFQDYVLYKLTEADLAKASQYRYIPTGIVLKSNGLDVVLAPKP